MPSDQRRGSRNSGSASHRGQRHSLLSLGGLPGALCNRTALKSDYSVRGLVLGTSPKPFPECLKVESVKSGARGEEFTANHELAHVVEFVFRRPQLLRRRVDARCYATSLSLFR